LTSARRSNCNTGGNYNPAPIDRTATDTSLSAPQEHREVRHASQAENKRSAKVCETRARAG